MKTQIENTKQTHFELEQAISIHDNVVVEFATNWSDHCINMDLMLDQLKSEFTKNTKVYKIDADKNRELIKQYDVKEIPSLLIFKKGKVVSCVEGLYWPKAVKENLITSLQKTELLKKPNVFHALSNFMVAVFM